MNIPTPDELAAEWLVRRDRGLTPAEQDDFLQWLAADPRHGEALARQQATWRELDLLSDWRPEHAPEPNPALLAPPRRAARRPFRWLVPVALASAAAVVAVFFFHRDARSHSPIVAEKIAVAIGYEQRFLDDGSLLELNRGASVVVAYTAAERRVLLLSGEARFTVAKNPTRPFVVSAAGVETRAIGTAFNVRLASGSVEVLVTEGRVQVAPSSPTPAPLPMLGVGEKLTVPLENDPNLNSSPAALVPVAVGAEEIARALAWQPRLLQFSSAPLAEVVAEFNRYNTLQLALADPALAAFPVTTSFRSDNAEGFVRLLEVTAGVQAERRGDTISLRLANSR